MRNAAVLRQCFLIRFQPREKFDAAKNALGHFGGKFRAGRDDAVEPEGNLRRLAAHLQMNVARPGAFGLLDQVLQNFRRGRFRRFFAAVWSVFEIIKAAVHSFSATR